MLAGDPPRERHRPPARSTDTDPAVLGDAQTRIRGKVVIVQAGANPAAQAAAAAAVGAARRRCSPSPATSRCRRSPPAAPPRR